jgi:hypothetical protein
MSASSVAMQTLNLEVPKLGLLSKTRKEALNKMKYEFGVKSVLTFGGLWRCFRGVVEAFQC